MTYARSGHFCIAALTAVTTALFARDARAQADSSTQTVIRRGLIENMQSAFERRDYAQCIQSGTRAASIRDTGSLRYIIAQCQLASNAYVGALGSAEECLTMLRRDTSAVGRDTLIAGCQRVESEARAHTGRLTVTAPSPAPNGMRIVVGGDELPSVTWGLPAIVNAGTPLDVVATAPGYIAFRGSVTVSPGSGAGIQVVLVRDSESRPTVDPASGASAPRVTVAPPPGRETAPSPPPTRGPSALLITGAVIGGVGAAAAGIGFALAAVAQGAYDGSCATPATVERYNSCVDEMGPAQAGVTARAAIGYAGLGLAAIGGGLAIVGAFTGRPRSSEARRGGLVVSPVAHAGFAGASVAARW